MDSIVGPNLFYHFVVSLLCSYTLAFGVANIIHHFIEAPCDLQIRKLKYLMVRNSDADVQLSAQKDGVESRLKKHQ